MDTEIQYKETEKFNKEVIREILNVQKEKGLTAENILEKAKDKKNPLHELFEWNNSQAGESWRLHQARLLINEVKVIINQKERYAFENVRVVINSSKDDEQEIKREYKPIVEILSNEEYRRQIVQTALENVTYWREKYSEYSELKPIFISIDKVKEKCQKNKK
jgi:hypothetical protein